MKTLDLNYDDDQDLNIESDIIIEEESSKKQMHIDVSIDSEFTDDSYLSLQFTLRFTYKKKSYYKNFFILDSSLQPFFSEEIIEKFCKETNTYVFFHIFINKDQLLSYYLTEYLFEYIDKSINHITISVNLYLFYSMKDLILALSPTFLEPYLLGKKPGLNQRRSISGFLQQSQLTLRKNHEFCLTQYTFTYNYKIKDLFGMEKSSLLKIALSCGLDVDDKNLLDIYKTNMLLACQNEPYLFLKYGIFDTEILLKIIDSKIKTANIILSKTFDVSESSVLYNKYNFPITIGSFVYSLWNKFFKYNFLKNYNLFSIVAAKQSILNENTKNYDKALEAFNNLKKIKSLQELRDLERSNSNVFKNIKKYLGDEKSIYYYPYQMLSPQYLVENSFNSTMSLLSLIQGGRAVNERPQEYFFSYTADIDISSAYGTCLMETIYPLGRPRFILKNSNQKSMKLGKFMNDYETSLIDGLYKIVVSGTLSFEQDLIFSKLIDIQNLNDKYKQYIFQDLFDSDDIFSNAAFCLLTKEIVNGVITSHTWNILKKVCSTQEMYEIRNLDIMAVAYYTKEDRVDSLEKLMEAWLKDNGNYEYNLKYQTSIDTRTHVWYGLKVSSFMEPLLKERQRLKKSPDPIDQATQNTLKLIINTTYGVLCSKFFPSISNVICADNITSATRANVWLMSRALNSFQSITDGGPYSLVQVFSLKINQKAFRKPSLQFLSNLYKLKNHRSISTVNLGSISWKKYFEENCSYENDCFKEIDKIAFQHIQNFWDNYQIKLSFAIEHKKSNLALRAATVRKADYAFLIYDTKSRCYDQLFYKIRGSNLNSNLKTNPTFDLLKTMINQNDSFDYSEDYEEIKSVKLLSWRKLLINRDDITSYKLKPNALPGDFIIQSKKFHLNNTFIRIDTEKLYKMIYNRRTKVKQKNELNVISECEIPLFEQFLKLEGIASTYVRMNNNDIRKRRYKKSK